MVSPFPVVSSSSSSTPTSTDDAPYRLLRLSTRAPWDGVVTTGQASDAPEDRQPSAPREDAFTQSQYTMNLVVGITASVLFILVTAAVLVGLVAFKRYMRRRNRTLSADTGVFSPRRGSKAGLDMIDNAVILTSHRPLQMQRSGSLRKQFQKFLTR